MDTSFASQIVAALKAQYEFRKVSGKWLQEGRCPDCNERELYTAAEDPKVVKCGRMNNCGFEISVRDALPDLFEDWSKRFEPTDTDPNATADAYLRPALRRSNATSQAARWSSSRPTRRPAAWARPGRPPWI